MDSMIIVNSPIKVIAEVIPANQYFPNNEHYPLLIYKHVLNLDEVTPEIVQDFLAQNGWINAWVDSIYDFHHYHSNTHEVLVVFAGEAVVQIGGENGKTFQLEKGDAIIFPAGVSHKKISSSPDFTTIGAYPFKVEYDMKYGKADEHPKVDENIRKAGLPTADPIFGKDGLLFDLWQ